MSLSDNLLDLAEKLVRLERGKPKQATLRRSVSTAYYAAFHLLMEDCPKILLGNAKTTESIRSVLARGVDHKVIKDVFEQIKRVAIGQIITLKVNHQTLDVGIQTADLKALAQALISSYEDRLFADYDTLTSFSRTQTLGIYQRAQTLFRLWRTLKQTQPETLKNLAACLMFRHK